MQTDPLDTAPSVAMFTGHKSVGAAPTARRVEKLA